MACESHFPPHLSHVLRSRSVNVHSFLWLGAASTCECWNCQSAQSLVVRSVPVSVCILGQHQRSSESQHRHHMLRFQVVPVVVVKPSAPSVSGSSNLSPVMVFLSRAPSVCSPRAFSSRLRRLKTYLQITFLSFAVTRPSLHSKETACLAACASSPASGSGAIWLLRS